MGGCRNQSVFCKATLFNEKRQTKLVLTEKIHVYDQPYAEDALNAYGLTRYYLLFARHGFDNGSHRPRATLLMSILYMVYS